MRFRPAEPGDRRTLREFDCGEPATKHAAKIDKWIRRKACGWSRASANNYLRLLVDDDDQVLGLYAFEPGVIWTSDGEQLALDPDGDPVVHWFVRVVAVAASRQEEGLGALILENCLAHVSEVEPDGGAYWKVESANTASHAMSVRIGAEPDPLVMGDLTNYFIQFG